MKEDELVLCTVESVTNTVTFVRTMDGRQGTIISSEIAPGRIKYMRQYVVPNKKIVCKVLKDSKDILHLSLRRVNNKEKKEVMQAFKQEQAINVALKQILGEESKKVREKILEKYENLISFVDDVRNDKKLLEEYFPKDQIGRIEKIVDKRRKNHEIRKKIELTCMEDNGVKRIKKIFNIKNSNLEITYISAGKYSLKLIVEDFKAGKKKLNEIMEDLERKTKKESCEIHFSD